MNASLANADFEQRVALQPPVARDWVASPMADETGDHPAGTYLRNPPGTGHAPFSREGCTLFVKLWQFARGDTQPVRIDTRSGAWYPGLVPGLSVMPLHEHAGISTALVKWAPDTRFTPHTHPGGEDILVLEVVFQDEYGAYPAGSWLRNPPGAGTCRLRARRVR